MMKVLITQRLSENQEYNETREQLDIAWGKFLLSANILPVVLPIAVDFNIYLNNFDIRGLVLTGGNDLGSVNTNHLSRQRDQFEKSLLREAVQRKIPVLGICRGMQLIAEYFDYSLKPVTGHVVKTHGVQCLLEGSRFFNVGPKNRTVNSYHHYSVTGEDNDLVVAVRSVDGEIEAVEHKSLPIAGMMWHPERNTPFDESDILFVKNFFAQKEHVT